MLSFEEHRKDFVMGLIDKAKKLPEGTIFLIDDIITSESEIEYFNSLRLTDRGNIGNMFRNYSIGTCIRYIGSTSDKRAQYKIKKANTNC